MIMHVRRPRGISIAQAVIAGLLFMFACAPNARADDCAPIYGSIFPPGRLARFSCNLISRETITTRHGPVQLIVWTRTPPVTGDLDSRARAVADAARRSIRVYDDFGPLPAEINVVATQGLEPAGSRERMGAENSEMVGMRCVADISLETVDVGFNLDGGGSDEEYRRFQDFEVAHEIFHCVQDLNFAEHMDNYHLHQWWADAQADYFPSLVVPRISSWFQNFDAESLHHSMFDMGAPAAIGYANVPFFAYLDARTNSQRIYDLTRRIPFNGSFHEQAEQLYATDVFFQYDVQNFAKAFFSGELRTRYVGHEIYETHPHFDTPFPVQGNVNLMFAPESAALIAADDLDDPTRGVMRFYRGLMEFPAHRRFSIQTSGGGNISLLADGYGWVDNPSGGGIDACDAPVSVLAVATAVDPNTPFRPLISIHEEREEHGEPVCGPRDPCLVGRWSVDPSEISRISTALGADAHATIERGPIEIAFAASGVWELVYNGLAARWQSSLGPSRLTFHGSAEGRWSAAHGSVRASLFADDSDERLHVGRARGTILPGVISAMRPPSTGTPYTCSGDTLTFTRASGGPMVYHRVSRDPGYPSRTR